MPKILIVSGGWEGHKPHDVAAILTAQLEEAGAIVENSRDIQAFLKSAEFDAVVPNWTMGDISHDQAEALVEAVEAGVGVAGIHGGMGDAFRSNTRYQFMCGGQFVEHPGGGERRFPVRFRRGFGLTAGLEDFEAVTESYYMHVDPAIRVLATTDFPDFGNTVMPVAWTKGWGCGRVFYCSLGHSPAVVKMPPVLDFVTRGILWAASRSSELQGSTFKEIYSG